MPADPRRSTAERTASTALEHLRRGRARIVARELRVGALRGAIWGGVVSTFILLTPPLGVDPETGRRAAFAALGLAIAFTTLRARSRCTSSWIATVWEGSLRQESTPSAGLIAAARSVLGRRDTDRREFEHAVLARFVVLPLPDRSMLARALPSPSSLGAVTTVVLVISAALIGSEIPAGEIPWRSIPSPRSATPTMTTSSGVDSSPKPAGERSDEIRRLRSEIELREELARLLEGSAALAPLSEVLREGGTHPPLPGLSARDRERLARIAARAESRGAPREWTEALLASAAGDEETPPFPFEWDDATELLAVAASDWVRGEIDGRANVSVPEWSDGGSGPGSRGERPEAPIPPATGVGEEPIEWPEGLPFAEGIPRSGEVAPEASPATFDPDEGWLRRIELEPRWFPVIDAYRRQESPR